MSAASKSHGKGSNPPMGQGKKPDRLFTLGIEEEFQIIDPETRELRSHSRSSRWAPTSAATSPTPARP